MFLKPKEKENTGESKIVDNIRALSIDMIHQAGSGHPGIALGAAPILYTLYAKRLRINPEDPEWLNRDRFILSCGHGSSLLYSTLYMAGYDLDLEDLKNFRTLHSKTPGHPEYLVTPGVEVSTGPLGQGLATAVGIALGSSYLKEYYHKKNINLFDYYTYVLCSDGDIMEGVSYEALALAGTLRLSNLIVLYDFNKICLDTNVAQVQDIDFIKYFQSLNWDVILVDGEDLLSLDGAIEKAKQSPLPSMIIVNTTIGKYSKLEGTTKVHGGDLTEEDITHIKNQLGIRDVPFSVSNEAKEEMQSMIRARSSKLYKKWQKDYEKLPGDIKMELLKIQKKDLSLDKLDIDYQITSTEEESLRLSSSKILNLVANNNPFFIGGSADLSSSVMTKLEDFPTFSKENHLGKNINYGVREHVAGAIMNGITLAGIRNFSSTYLAFSDYLKPAIRLACQMKLPNIYIFSHDSITVGADGPTHQPVEQLAALRSTPNLEVFRPADVNEMIGTYKYVLSISDRPCAIVLGRNTTKIKEDTSINEIEKGAYIVKKEEKELTGIIVSCGEELDLALSCSQLLQEKGYNMRVVSMPSSTLYLKQPQAYQEKIIPKEVPVFVIETSSSFSWDFLVPNRNYLFTQNEFGLSASKDDILKEFGFTEENITQKIEELLK